jgi:hypothetical protein
MSGVVMVQSTCSELSITAQQISPIAYKLAFATWEEPNVPCDRTPTPRSFHTIVFAPAVGVVFIGTMDDRAIPLVVTPVIERS